MVQKKKINCADGTKLLGVKQKTHFRTAEKCCLTKYISINAIIIVGKKQFVTVH